MQQGRNKTRQQKGDLRTWSAEDKALFDWLYGSAETCADVSEYPVSMEKAMEIALSALPEPVSNPELSFRYCSKCIGNREYCSEHLFTHEHYRG